MKGIFEEFSQIPSSINWFDPSSFSSKYPLLSQYGDKTFGELVDGLIFHPSLKAILSIRTSYALLPPEEISVVGMAGIEMSYFNHGVSCVEGKVEELPLRLGETLQKMGGKILIGHEAQEILIEGKTAIGVRLKDGQEMTGKVIVSNIDAYTTFSDLFGRGFHSEWLSIKIEKDEAFPFLFYPLSGNRRGIGWTISFK